MRLSLFFVRVLIVNFVLHCSRILPLFVWTYLRVSFLFHKVRPLKDYQSTSPPVVGIENFSGIYRHHVYPFFPNFVTYLSSSFWYPPFHFPKSFTSTPIWTFKLFPIHTPLHGLQPDLLFSYLF